MFNKKEYMKEYRKLYWKNNHKRLIKKHIEWQKNNPEKVSKNSKHYYENHPERFKKYHNENYEKIKISHRQYMNMKRKTDLKFNLNHKVSKAILKALKGNKYGRHWEDLVGYTLKDLIKRLKKTMPIYYTWQDFLQGKLHIDHKIPISAFNFTKPEHTDFKRCWYLSNLRLLPVRENLVKSNKLSKPFQLALKI